MTEDIDMDDAPQDEPMADIAHNDGHESQRPAATWGLRNELPRRSRRTARTPSPFRLSGPSFRRSRSSRRRSRSPYVTPERQEAKDKSPHPSGELAPAFPANDGHASPTLAPAATNELLESHPTGHTPFPLGQADHNIVPTWSFAGINSTDSMAVAAIVNPEEPPRVLEPPITTQPHTATIPAHFAFAPPVLQRSNSNPAAPPADHPSQQPTHANPHTGTGPREPSPPSSDESVDIFIIDWHSHVFNAMMIADPERPGFATEKFMINYLIEKNPDLSRPGFDTEEVGRQVQLTLSRGTTAFRQERWKGDKEGWEWSIKGFGIGGW